MANQFNVLDVNNTLVDAGRGKISGARPFSGFGEKVTTGADSGLLWPDGVFTYPPSAGVQVSIVSTSASDGVGGTGIRTLAIHYLDANLNEMVEVVTMNGITPVLTVATNIRFIQCMHLVTFGSTEAAVGTITATNGASTYSQVYPGSVRCSSSLRMVPKGKRLIVSSLFAGSVSGAGAARSIVRVSTPTFEGYDFTTTTTFIPMFSASFQDSSAGISLPCPIVFTEGQSVGMTFECDKVATITGSWFGTLENA